MKASCVEFYQGHTLMGGWHYAWRLRAKNGRIILTPGETFVSHRNAVESFKRVCIALDARGPWEIKDMRGVTGSHALLIAA